MYTRIFGVRRFDEVAEEGRRGRREGEASRRRRCVGGGDKMVCGSKDFGGNQTVFNANAIKLVRNLSAEAPKNGGFFVGSVSNGNLLVYGLAQCWELVNGSTCEKCLANSLSKIGSCLSKEDGRVLNAGCYLRYSTQRFYNNSATDAKGGDEDDQVMNEGSPMADA
ncbi:hypothetical protein L1049_026462 [Liquidambar formosana]|uniref:Gnk2-homologous domain-containing protein n=1 Tax=Liquidambar formosana TaxID=63359 RepID=A0AAP0NF10_LIQFO